MIKISLTDSSVKADVFNIFDGVKNNGKDYDISYQNGVNVGCQTCTVTVSGIGDYTGSVSKKVTIKPPKLAAPATATTAPLRPSRSSKA